MTATDDTMQTPAPGYENSLKHFEDIISLYQPDGAYSPSPSVSYEFITCRHHLGGGLYNPYLAVRATRRIDGRVLYTNPAHIIRWEDGTASVWWWGGKSKIFASDHPKLPARYA